MGNITSAWPGKKLARSLLSSKWQLFIRVLTDDSVIKGCGVGVAVDSSMALDAEITGDPVGAELSLLTEHAEVVSTKTIKVVTTRRFFIKLPVHHFRIQCVTEGIAN